jgi:hypothetical protein
VFSAWHNTDMRRAGISFVILLIVPASYDIQAAADPGTLATGSAPAVASTEDPAMAWRSDATVAVLSTELDRFFGKETGDYIYVRDEDVPRRQANGEFLLADQFRLPLFSLASIKTVLPEDRFVYQAFVHRVPMVRAFIMTDIHNNIIAAALADMMSIKKDGAVVDVVPRITVFYRTAPPPKEFAIDCVNRKNSSEMRELLGKD